jgi:hypothetical protein
MNTRQIALIRKDLQEVFGNRQILIPLFLVPVLMMILLPGTLLIGLRFGHNSLSDLDAYLQKFPQLLPFVEQDQNLIFMALNYYFPSLFLLIPIMASSIIGAACFVGEKEHKTLESLFYTPLTITELFWAKVWGTFCPAYLVAAVSFVLFGVVVNTGAWPFFHHLIFPNGRWLLIILWLVPAVTGFGLAFVVWISARVSTFQAAQQMVGLIVLPFILIMVGQTTGLYLVNNATLMGAGAVFYLLDWVIVRNVSRNFTYERLLK